MVEDYIPMLRTTYMFRGIEEDKIKPLLECLNATVKKYGKGEFILERGAKIHTIAMVLSGLVMIEQDDYWGNNTILQEFTPGFLFAESYAFLPEFPVDVNVVANEPTEIMFFDTRKIIGVCGNSCAFHTQLIGNLLGTISNKNILLTKKVSYMAKKTIRDRLLSYLSDESLKRGKSTFRIPFDRQQLSEYLSVDRSALSSEISKLQKEGLLQCKKSVFTLREDALQNY